MGFWGGSVRKRETIARWSDWDMVVHGWFTSSRGTCNKFRYETLFNEKINNDHC